MKLYTIGIEKMINKHADMADISILSVIEGVGIYITQKEIKY
jgi:hypothetical protein